MLYGSRIEKEIDKMLEASQKIDGQLCELHNIGSPPPHEISEGLSRVVKQLRMMKGSVRQKVRE